jgi:hypothetical protein
MTAAARCPSARQADCFAYAALDATGTPSINPLKVAIALDDAELTQAAFWP